MLLDLRETVRNSKPIKYSLITLICIPFALVGIGSYFSGGTAAPVAEVNGQPIDQQQLERAYQQQRQQVARMFGGQIPEAFANEAALREQALQQLITQQVLESEVVNQQFAVGDKTLGRAIRNLPAFQVDGKFDQETYQAQLRASGMSVPAFEQSYRDDTALNQFRTGVIDTSFILPSEAEQLSALMRQTRTIEGVQFDFEQAKADIDIAEDDVVAYFEDNKDNYQFPQRARIQYLELNAEELAGEVDVSDEQAQDFYDANRGNFMLPEQREASHILLSADEGDAADQTVILNEVRERIAAGEVFADIAKELSDDVGSAEMGGSLGTISPGAMVPEFEEAVFALENAGDLSEPVVTEFGVHLIQLDNISPETGKSFEEVREEIKTTMQQDEADSSYFELREQLAELTFDNSGSLEPASDATGLEIKTSDWLDSDTDSGPVLSSPQVMGAVFSDEVLNEENNSELLEVGQRHIVALRVLEHEEPRPKTIEDVREEIVDTLKGERATKALEVRQADAIEKLTAGESASDIAGTDESVTVFEQEVLERTSTTFDRNVLTQVFALPKLAAEVVTDTATLSNGDLLAMRLDSIDVAEELATQEEAVTEPSMAESPLASGADPRLGGTEFEVLLESLREQADIDLKDVSAGTSAYGS